MFISPSKFLRDRFIDWGLPEKKIRHVENGTEVRPFHKSQKKSNDRHEGGAAKKVKIGFIGTLKSDKAPHLILEALNLMEYSGSVVVKIYGDTTVDPIYANFMKRLVRKGEVTFMGKFGEDEKPAIYRDMSALVVPSVWFENSPVTIHEAFAAEIPVITSDIGGMKELVTHGKNGLLFQAGSVPDLAKKLDEFVGDNKLRECLRNGIKKVKTMDEHGNEILKIYKNVIDDAN